MLIATPRLGRTAIAASLTLAVGVSSAAVADTITVCLDGTCDFTDPAAAAAVAVDGDVIEIAAGTYLLNESVVLYAQQVVVRGAVDKQGRPLTILDAQGATTVFNGLVLTPDARLENLVFTNGHAEYGAGMFLFNSDPVMRNCVITGNHADIHGGGLFLNSGSSPTLIGCRIAGNTVAHPTSDTLGIGAAGWVSDGVLTLRDCEVTGNAAAVAGGGFGFSSVGVVVLENGRLCGNSAPTNPQVHGLGTVTILGGCLQDDCDDCASSVPADLNGDGAVNGADLGLLLAAWGSCDDCPADLSHEGLVNGADLGLLLAAWTG